MATDESTTRYRGVPGFSGYRVGDDGSVWSCWTNRGTIGDVWKRLKLGVDKDGYLKVGLRASRKKQTTFRVAILVLTAFVGPRPPGKEACHAPGTSVDDNRLSSLR